jgi:hypothetical protein
MKPQSIFGAVTALGILSSSIASTTLMSTTAALADDWPNSNDRPAWSQRCDRDWDNAYCNPKVDSNYNQNWVDLDRSQTQDPWNRDRQWQTRDRDRWENSDPDQWQRQDQEQWRDQKRYFRSRLSAGTYIPAYPDRSEGRIVLRRQERYPLTLVVSQDVGRSSGRGIVALPRNSRIEGELIPTRNGYRFEANRVRLPNGQQAQIWAVSNVIRQSDDYDRYDRRDANVSSGASSILNAILGRSNSDSSVLGDVFDRYPNARRDLVVIYPDRSLDLKLTRDFVMDWRNF